jgi:hypothetical protein
MSESRNGWETWYQQWDEVYSEPDSVSPFEIIPYNNLASWGEEFRRYVTLNDHWTGYVHTGPMSLEDGMSIAYVLYDVGIDVDSLLDVLSAFQPLEGASVDLTIPLCWLTEPMDHVQDLLGMLIDLTELDPEIFAEIQQMLEDMLGETPMDPEELPEIFRTIITSTVQWLLEMMRILGDSGMIALRAWWQGRLIAAMREAAPPPRKSRVRRHGEVSHKEMPSAFRDLIQSLDFHGLDEESDEDD